MSHPSSSGQIRKKRTSNAKNHLPPVQSPTYGSKSSNTKKVPLPKIIADELKIKSTSQQDADDLLKNDSKIYTKELKEKNKSLLSDKTKKKIKTKRRRRIYEQQRRCFWLRRRE